MGSGINKELFFKPGDERIVLSYCFKNIDYFYSPDANKQVTEDIEKFTKNKNFRKIYNNFFCLFVVTTDLWFLLFIVVLFQLEKYLLILLILIYVPLYFINFVRDYKSLCKQEIDNWNKRSIITNKYQNLFKKNKYD